MRSRDQNASGMCFLCELSMYSRRPMFHGPSHSYYRPQRSWAKVISLQASVCPHGGGGGGCLLQIFGGASEIFFSFFKIYFPPKNFFWDAHPPPPPPRWSMRGRYASYWNAFLFQLLEHRTVTITGHDCKDILFVL